MSMTVNPEYVEAIYYQAQKPTYSFKLSPGAIYNYISIPSMDLKMIDHPVSITKDAAQSKLAYETVKKYNDDMIKSNVPIPGGQVLLDFIVIGDEKDKEAEQKIFVRRDLAERIKELDNENVYGIPQERKMEIKAEIIPLIKQVFEDIKTRG